MIDILGHPIGAGMTVLTNKYYSSSMGEITTVDRVTKKAVIVTIHAYDWYYDEVLKRGITTPYKKQIRKRPDQIIVIDKQLNHNQKNYPENMI